MKTNAISNFAYSAIDKQRKLDEQYPNRHKTIHKGCCKHCPSDKFPEDPESADIKTLPKEVIAREYLFVCAWRNSKLCKGNCDNMEIDQKYLDSLYKDEDKNM